MFIVFKRFETAFGFGKRHTKTQMNDNMKAFSTKAIFQLKEWLSESFLNGSNFKPNPEKDLDYNQLYGKGKEVETSVTIAMERMCEILYSVKETPWSFKISSYLWIVLAIVMFGGLFGFGKRFSFIFKLSL